MSDEKIKFDKYQQVEEALKKSAADSDSKSSRLVIVVVCQVWHPPSLALAKECEKIRSAKIPTIKSPIFLIDADDDKNKTWEINVNATPAVFFYIGGQPLTVRRSAYADDEKFVGSCSKDNLVELLQSARTAENEGAKVLYADF